jgi:predicted permease
VPLSGTLGFTTVDLESRPEEPGGEYIVADLAYSGPGYLETMGIPLLEGRAFQAGDGAQGSRAAMVSASFARRWWPQGSPLGHRISGGGLLSQEWWEVVGVVGDVHQASLAQDPGDMIYLPITAGSREAPYTLRAVDIVVRTTTSPLDFLPVLQRELSALNPRIPLANPRSVRDVVRRATAQTSFTMAVLGSSAGIALLLGLVGIYGVVSYLVSLRKREIGVRMALGATGSSVRRMVVLQGLRLGAMGTLVGLAAAGAMSSIMASLLFGVRALDPVTYGTVASTLLAVAALAAWLPAARAARVDPGQTLREE